MFPTLKISILAMAGALLLLSAASSRVAWAQNGYNESYYNTDPVDVTYPIFDVDETEGPRLTVPTADNLIRLDNPTFHTTPAIGGKPGLCAFIYVFDDAEEPIECCGCGISNDGELTLSVEVNLTNNPETLPVDGLRNTHGTIQIVSGNPNAAPIAAFGGSNCDPTGSVGSVFGGTAIVPDATIREWIAHEPLELMTDYPPLQTVGLIGDIHAAEVPFLAAPLTPQHLLDIEDDCTFLIANGSGRGLCSCTDFTPPPPPPVPPPSPPPHFE